jgi:hypothetical protein
VAFIEDRRLPSGVRGPVDLAALRRLDSALKFEDIADLPCGGNEVVRRSRARTVRAAARLHLSRGGARLRSRARNCGEKSLLACQRRRSKIFGALRAGERKRAIGKL